MFDWNDLSYFLELARQGRLMPAAKRLRVDHTTISRRISELEKALDCKLFTRTPSGFVLTDAGRQLLEHAIAVEAKVIAITETIGNNPAQASGSVRLGTMEGIASMYLAERMAELHRQHPAIQIELLTERHVANLPRREADVLLSFVQPTGPKLAAQKIGDFGLSLYASPAYLERAGEPQTVRELEDHLFIDYIEDIILVQATHWLADVVANPTVVFRTSSMLAQQNAAAAGLGLVLLPMFSAFRDNRLRRVLPDTVAKRDIWLSVHEDMQYLSRVKAVTRFLGDTIKRDQEFLRTGVPA